MTARKAGLAGDPPDIIDIEELIAQSRVTEERFDPLHQGTVDGQANGKARRRRGRPQ